MKFLFKKLLRLCRFFLKKKKYARKNHKCLCNETAVNENDLKILKNGLDLRSHDYRSVICKRFNYFKGLHFGEEINSF